MTSFVLRVSHSTYTMRARHASKSSLKCDAVEYGVMKVPAWPRTQLYKRIFRIGGADIRTVNPATGRTTNCWLWEDFLRVTLTGDSFMLSVRRQRSSRIDSVAFCSVGSVSARLVRTLRTRHAQFLMLSRSERISEAPGCSASPTRLTSPPQALPSSGGASASAESRLPLPALRIPDSASSTPRGGGSSTLSVVSERGSPDAARTPGPSASTRVSVRIELPDHPERASLLLSLRKVSVILFTVTFYANLAHSLTRSP